MSLSSMKSMSVGHVLLMSLVWRALCADENHGKGPDSCEASVTSEPAALELVATDNCSVYLGKILGKDEATIDKITKQFDDWSPSNGWSTNALGARFTTFNSNCLYASPGQAGLGSVQIDADEPWAEEEGRLNWSLLAQICTTEVVMGGCYPEACDGSEPKNGSIKYYEINKCQMLRWNNGSTVNVMIDPDKNEYIMHATSNSDNSEDGIPVGNPTLPDGWSTETQVLQGDLVLAPEPNRSMDGKEITPGARYEFGDAPCGYALVADSGGNGYHRFKTTTGYKVVEGKLKLIANGRTSAEMKVYARTMIIIVGVVSLVLISACIGYCVYRRTASESEQVELGVPSSS